MILTVLILFLGGWVVRRSSDFFRWVGDKVSKRSKGARAKRIKKLQHILDQFNSDLEDKNRHLMLILTEMGTAGLYGVFGFILLFGCINMIEIMNLNFAIIFFHPGLPSFTRLMMEPGGKERVDIYDYYVFPIALNIFLLGACFCLAVCQNILSYRRRFLDPSAFINKMKKRIDKLRLSEQA